MMHDTSGKLKRFQEKEFELLEGEGWDPISGFDATEHTLISSGSLKSKGSENISPSKTSPVSSFPSRPSLSGLMSSFRARFSSPPQEEPAPVVSAPPAPPPVPKFTAESLQNLLLWDEPRRSAIVMSCGLYTLLCLHQLFAGHLPLQPLSVGYLSVIACVVYRPVKRVYGRWRAQRPTVVITEGPSEGALGPEGSLEGSHGSAVAFVETHVKAAAELVAPVLAAVTDSTWHVVSGRAGLGAAAWLIFWLWMALCVSELRILSQPLLLYVTWLALWTLPPCYTHNRHAINESAGAIRQLARNLMQEGDRRKLAMSGIIAAAVFAVLGGIHIFFKLPVALSCGLGMYLLCSPQKVHRS